MTPTKKENKAEKKAKVSQKNAVATPQANTSKTEGDFEHVFENLKKHFEPEKVDEFQKKWLALPENRKKYEKLTDAPQVAIEEVIAMTNDLIQYIQGQPGGNSGFLKRIKSGFSSFFKNPAKYVQDKAETGKEMALEMKDSAVEKVKDVASDVKDSAQEKVEQVTDKAQKAVKKTVKKAAKKTQSAVKKTVNSAKKVTKSSRKK